MRIRISDPNFGKNRRAASPIVFSHITFSVEKVTARARALHFAYYNSIPTRALLQRWRRVADRVWDLAKLNRTVERGDMPNKRVALKTGKAKMSIEVGRKRVFLRVELPADMRRRLFLQLKRLEQKT